jgi:hypothetical protein
VSCGELTTALGLALERSTEAYRYARLHEAPADETDDADDADGAPDVSAT